MKIITKKEAIEQGLSRYFTGRPCKYGHIDERRVHNRECCGCIKEYSKKKYSDNKKDMLECNKEWRLKNREYLAEYRRNKRNNDPLEKLRSTIHNMINRLLTDNKVDRSYEILGYTPSDLKIHLESKWESWMSWDNYGLGDGCWVIDHIRPVKSFYDEGITDISIINSLDNLQPLCFRANLSKGCQYN